MAKFKAGEKVILNSKSSPELNGDYTILYSRFEPNNAELKVAMEMATGMRVLYIKSMKSLDIRSVT